MRPSDKPEFLKILNGLAAVKPGAKLTVEALDVWWVSLIDWPIEAFRVATKHFAKSMEFMPSPYHYEQLKKAALPTGEEAWGICLKRSVNWRYGITEVDRIDRIARLIGGYEHIAMANTETALPHIQRRFLDAWKNVSEAETVREQVPQIAGPRSQAALEFFGNPDNMQKLLPSMGDRK